jgi:phosphoribosyl 1,2-cyclic phosphate phosphodiesterase
MNDFLICPPITITFLGTGTSSGVPMIGCKCEVCTSKDKKDTRLRTSILIASEKTTVVIDTTPDFRYQMLRAKVEKLDAVIFTHPHKDHIGGLDDVRAFNYFSEKPMELYTNALTEKAIRNDFHYAFTEEQFPGLPMLSFKRINELGFFIGDIPFLPINVLHYKMRVLGFRVGKMAYITDANFISESELEKCNGINLLIVNMLRKEPHLSHFSLSEAIEVGNKMNAKDILGTHISHQLGKHDDIIKELPTNVSLAFDTLSIKL